MTTAFRVRLALLVAGMGMVAGLMLWSVQSSWHRITQLERKLTGAHLESFRLAADFQQRLLRLNGAIFKYAVRGEAATWAEFEQASAQLDHWIDEQNPKLSTAEERALLDQINTTYDIYLEAARRLHTNQQPATATGPEFAQLEDFDAQSRRLLQLGTRLSEAHRVAEESFLTGANQALAKLRASLLGSLLVLLGLVSGLGWVIYRVLIAPLRIKLVQSEALLEKQEKLATLGTLAAGIAHEIRNPLTSVKARLYTLDKHLDAPALARKDAEIISTEISRLECIVQEVLSFARPSEPELRILAAAALFREIQALMSSSLDSRAVRLVVEPGPELFVQADVAQLKQVLINLVRNAAEAIEGEGTITLRLRADHVRLRGQLRDVAVLEVVDTGKGIPAEIQERLFDPFFTTKEAGTGLGLSIAARIIEKHGGALQYQTRAGRGTIFGIVLPQAPRGGANGRPGAPEDRGQ
jgi:signal transduction histidine kinase